MKKDTAILKRSVQYLFTLGIFTLLSGASSAQAVSSNLVISQIQAGAASGMVAAATQEFVSVYNNSDQDIDVTNWCLVNKNDVIFACMVPEFLNQTLHLTAHSHMTMVSDTFAAQHIDYSADVIFPTVNNASGSITGGNDSITLKDAQDVDVDTITWTTSLTGGSLLQRAMIPDTMTMIDTDSIVDFSKQQGVILPISGVYEILTITDECPNLDGIQEVVSEGYLKSAEGDCVRDVCLNFDDLQTSVPESYVQNDVGECVFDFVALQITELLPNVTGSDVGYEFIELYNPSDKIVLLSHYALRVGEKMYDFPADAFIDPGQYKAFYNNEIAFTLPNTRSSVALLADDGAVISQTDMYDTPKDNMAWAIVDDVWQHTNQPTAGAINLVSIIEAKEVIEVAQLQPCAINQYRHPETQRCRLLVTIASTAVACKDGQYRSEETNRCRNIALAGGTLTPCGDNQYRSEETNRCRNLAVAAGALLPCKDNQYRSEETNRCRTFATTTVPSAAFAVEPIVDTGRVFAGWWALGGIGALAIGYGVWEWRREAFAVARKFAAFFTRQ